MIAGVIEIQMAADLARLRQDMDKATGMVESAMADISKAVDVAKFALGALAGVASVSAFKSMISGAIDAAEALHDLSIQTGASVESLSAMAKIGVTTDTSAQAISAAMNKLAKNMAVANEESKGTGQALKALGIDFDTFRQMKPDDQMLTLAQAMAKFEDGSGKSAVAMTLLGKEGAKLLPFMADLAASGQLVATVTTEQADMADQYNDTLAMSAERVENLKRQFALGLLPTLLDVLNLSAEFTRQLGEYASGANSAGRQIDIMGGGIRVLGTILEAVMVLGSDVVFVFKGIGREIGGLAAQAVALATGNFSQVGAIHEEMKRDAASSRAELDKFQAGIMGTTDRLLQARDAMRNHSLSAAENNRELGSLGARHGAVTKSTLDYKAAGDAAAETDRAAAAEKKRLDEAYRKVKDSITDKIGAMILEDQAGEKLTEGQKLALKVMQDLQTGHLKLTDARKMEITALLETMLATEQVNNTRKEEAALQKLITDDKAKIIEALGRETEEQQKLLDKQLQENEVLRVGENAIRASEAARLRETAAQKEAIAATSDQSAELMKQAAILRQRADALNEGVALKEARAAADEWKKTTDQIGQGLTDSLFRAFESGKGFFRTLWDGIVNTFKTTVLRPTIEAVMKPITGSIGSFFGMTGSAGASTGGASGLGSLGSLASIGTSISGFGSGLGAGFSAILGEAGLSGGVSAGLTAIGAGNVAGGLGTLAGSLGPYALAAVAAYMIADKLFGSKGGPKVEGMASTGNFAGIPAGGAGNSDAASILSGLQSQYSSLTSVLGGSGSLTGATYFAQDPKGDALTQLVLDAAVNGKEVFSRNNRTSGGNVEDVGRTAEAFAAAVADAQTRALLASLQATTYADPAIAQAIAAISTSGTAEQISAQIKAVADKKAADDAAAAAAASAASGSSSDPWASSSVMSGITPTQYDDGVASLRAAVDELKAEVVKLKADNTAENTSMAVALSGMFKILERITGGGDNPGDAISTRERPA